MHIIKSCLGICNITIFLSGCSSLQHDKHQPIATTRIQCEILAREKSLSDAIRSGDKAAYIEHLTDTNKQDEENLDKTIFRLHQAASASSSGISDPHRSEVRQYYGTIKLNREKTLAYANHGFGIARCLGCRAIRFDNIRTMKAVWQLDNDGRWRRRSNKLGPSISRFKFKYNETQCPGLQNED
jgi:hypothetical protein